MNDWPLLDPLTSREIEILRLLAERRTNREIAESLYLSLETIKWYNKQIYSKLGVSSRTEAVETAIKLGLLDAQGELDQNEQITPKHNLPAQFAPFIGRNREVAELRQLLAQNRLVTLTGPGGTGKTRLALRLAELLLNEYQDGVFFINLLTASNADQVPKAIAQELGLFERPNQPLDQILTRFLTRKKMLLLLDNFEHVQEAALPVSNLLLAAPDLTILATSREPLHLTGEQEYLVPPMTLPDHLDGLSPTDLMAYEAVTLFVHRARSHSFNFELTEENAPIVARICLRLDGLPLAIELAAPLIKMLSLKQILERLESRLGLLVSGPRDLPDRQRTLRSTIDWSYQMLTAEEQRLFARLAVFTGGCSLDAIETVGGANLSGDPFDYLSSLLHKNLIFQKAGPGGNPRFTMLETIQEFAAEQLTANSEENEIKDRHLAYFLSLVEGMEEGYLGHDQQRLLEQTAVEMGNIRKAFYWGIQSAQYDAAARLISAADYYFRYKDGLVEAYQWVQQFLPHIDDITLAARARFLLTAGRLAWYTNDFGNNEIFILQARVLAQEIGDQRLLAGTFIEPIFDPQNPQESAVRDVERGLKIFRELDFKPGIAHGLSILGEIYRIGGNVQRAQEYYEEGLQLAEETGELNRQDMLRANLGFIAYQKGEYERCRDIFRTIVKYRSQFRIWQWTITSLVGLAAPISHLGDPQKATRLLGAQAALMDDYGLIHQPTDQTFVAQVMADVKAQLGEESFTAAWFQGQEMSLQEAVAYALSD